MHEVHLVRAIVEAVEKQAESQRAKSVTHVTIRFNPLTSHSGDHVQFSFDVVKKETRLLQKANLQLNEVEPLLCCNACGTQFVGEHLPDLCPNCGAIDVKAVHSTAMELEGFEIEK